MLSYCIKENCTKDRTDLMATLVQTTYSTCWEKGLMKENAFIANHTHF